MHDLFRSSVVTQKHARFVKRQCCKYNWIFSPDEHYINAKQKTEKTKRYQ